MTNNSQRQQILEKIVSNRERNLLILKQKNPTIDLEIKKAREDNSFINSQMQSYLYFKDQLQKATDKLTNFIRKQQTPVVS